MFRPERMGPLQSPRRETGFAGKRSGSETGGYSANSGMELIGACEKQGSRNAPEGEKALWEREEEQAQGEALCGNPHRRANKPCSDAVIVCHAGPVICFKL